jgi:hypothetical protein
VKKRPYYVFVPILYASDVSQLRTAPRNQWFTMPCHASRRKVPSPVYPLAGPIYRNLKIYRYILYRYTLYRYTGLYRYRPALDITVPCYYRHLGLGTQETVISRGDCTSMCKRRVSALLSRTMTQLAYVNFSEASAGQSKVWQSW